MFDDALVQQLAAELQRSQQTRTPVEHFSKRHPGMTVDDGYRIGRAWVELQKAEGQKVIGHKIGLTSRAMQISSQIDEPDYGTLLDNMLYTAQAGEVLEIPVQHFIAPRVEVELAFVLKAPLAGLVGWLLLGQTPSIWFWPGAALIVGAPAIGGALFIADKLLGGKMSSLTSVEYRAVGPLDNPTVSFVKPF